ncbi:hypothetical protein M6B38_223035 [Iris pallida]|uniref:Uncharacterized protein n=1 Tax=Iris pallida TaxID=29817 RepID=A0AAX6DWR3_IRIPA|nr:hypothetical protein M6B38_223035 [Iris pallida]
MMSWMWTGEVRPGLGVCSCLHTCVDLKFATECIVWVLTVLASSFECRLWLVHGLAGKEYRCKEEI